MIGATDHAIVGVTAGTVVGAGPNDRKLGAMEAGAMEADALLAAGDAQLSEEADLCRFASEAIGIAAASGCARLVAALLAGCDFRMLAFLLSYLVPPILPLLLTPPSYLSLLLLVILSSLTFFHLLAPSHTFSHLLIPPPPASVIPHRSPATLSGRGRRASPDGLAGRRERGVSPLMRAAALGHTETVATLLAAEASANLPSPTQATAAHAAASSGHLASLSLLLRGGAALHARDMNKWSLLYHACWGGHPECVRLLLERGATVNTLDRWARSPLCWACCRGQVLLWLVVALLGVLPRLCQLSLRAGALAWRWDLSLPLPLTSA